ncbi:MAG: DUF3592 domain-containing protein [Kiritimatiellaeota bacterium]|nr:DUF3592 domain-containing protein [Kiritimatiellota bacterium]
MTTNIYLGIGSAIFSLAGVWVLYRALQLWKHGVLATGTVVEKGTRRGKKGAVLVYPIIEYATPSGEKHRLNGVASASDKVPIGATVDILYWPGNPRRAREKKWLSFFVPPVALWVLAAAFAAAALKIIGQ